ncbi:MAG TPA: hypothetical protein VGG05_16710 [Pseudonocardiaceae bacterium]
MTRAGCASSNSRSVSTSPACTASAAASNRVSTLSWWDSASAQSAYQ